VFWPVHITILGTNIPCGSAASALLNTSHSPIAQDCQATSLETLQQFGIAGIVLVVIGTAIAIVGKKESGTIRTTADRADEWDLRNDEINSLLLAALLLVGVPIALNHPSIDQSWRV